MSAREKIEPNGLSDGEVRLLMDSRALSVDDLVRSVAGPADGAQAAIKMDEATDALVKELIEIRRVADRTKIELAALQARRSGHGRSVDVGREIDAAKHESLTATNVILAAAESIDRANAEDRRCSDSSNRSKLHDAIDRHLTEIFQACNFQDLTGQRLSKVAAAVAALEARVDTLIEIWGGASLAAHLSNPVVETEEERLLNGPKLDANEGAMDQCVIDDIFA